MQRVVDFLKEAGGKTLGSIPKACTNGLVILRGTNGINTKWC